MDKYLIALDLDETLLNSKKQVTEKTLTTLMNLKNKGFIIAISSTRGYGSCKQIADLIKADYICCQSGNMIANNKGEIVYSNAFAKKEVSDFLDNFSKYTDMIYLDSYDGLYGKDIEEGEYWGIIPCSIQDLYNIETFKLCIYFKPEYKKQIFDYCEKNNYICRPMRGADLMLITPQNSDKYYALEKLMEIENTDIDHLIVFGDATSDLLSIQKAKYGVAVSNAKDEVLKEAKFITLSNDNDGVADFLQKTFPIR